LDFRHVRLIVMRLPRHLLQSISAMYWKVIATTRLGGFK
jgi:hypothetical protein